MQIKTDRWHIWKKGRTLRLWKFDWVWNVEGLTLLLRGSPEDWGLFRRPLWGLRARRRRRLKTLSTLFSEWKTALKLFMLVVCKMSTKIMPGKKWLGSPIWLFNVISMHNPTKKVESHRVFWISARFEAKLCPGKSDSVHSTGYVIYIYKLKQEWSILILLVVAIYDFIKMSFSVVWRFGR